MSGIIPKGKAKALAQDPKTCIYTYPEQFDEMVNLAIRTSARAGGLGCTIVVIAHWGQAHPADLAQSLKAKLKDLNYTVSMITSIPDEIALTISWE